MSGKGNLKDEGNKGNNFPFQFNMLRAIGNLAALAPSSGYASEGTLLSVLAALQNGQDFEQNLVIDTGGAGCPGNCPTYFQVRIFNTDTHTFDPPIYYDVNGSVVTPVGPLEIVNPQYVLQNIQAYLASIDGKFNVNLSTLATEVTLASLLTYFTSALSRVRNTSLSNSPVAVKASSGSLWGWNLINSNNAVVYVKVYDETVVSTTVGTTAPVMVLMVPANGSVYMNPSESQLINVTAITIACVTGISDSSTSAPAAPIYIEMSYK